ncbi:MAG: hypothetical protein VX304_06665 [Planctomycetota bacterium]|nr:hypothetical protein [Planctomycetota bacterium]
MPTDETTAHIVKLGGSLLDWPDTPSRLAEILESPATLRPLLIIGGGPTADIVRSWHSSHQLSENQGHTLALDAMGFNSGLLRTLLPRTLAVKSRSEALAAWAIDRWPVLDCGSFLAREEPVQPLQLPHTWDATSDAIAAWVALAWPASRLTLLKSIDLPGDTTASQLAAAGHVDVCLADWLDRLPPTDWVNLRAATTQPTQWPLRAEPPTP